MKIKKIFIMSVISTLLIPAIGLAQAGDGYCYRPDGSKIRNTRVTKAQCDSLGGLFFVNTPPACNWALEILTLPLDAIPGTGTAICKRIDQTGADATITNTSPYVLLAPLPCDQNTEGCVQENGSWVLKTSDPAKDNALSYYLNTMFKIFIGICAVLAMAMIILGGLEYMTSELVSSKESAKHRITGALLGLVLALGSYAILNTINPDLLKSEIAVEDAKVVVELLGESPDPFTPLTAANLQPLGINCPGSGGKTAVANIGRQFVGKTEYSMAAGRRNTIQGQKVILDCSAYVAQVYRCAGMPAPGGNTFAMFSSGAQSVDGTTYDFNQLNPGDLIGWKQGDGGERYGHVAIYLGNGQMLDTQPTGTQVRPLSSIKNRITYVKWSN